MAQVKPDVETFRAKYPAFADPAKYPDAVLQNDLEQAQCFISIEPCAFDGSVCRLNLVYMLAAHIQALADTAAQNGGNTPGFTASASVGSVSVSLTPPPVKNQFDYWLSLTPYGQQLAALLALNSGVGVYFGGEFEQVFR